jgi:hypothetical protein
MALFKFEVERGLFAMNLGIRAVLKPPQSRRWRGCRRASNFAKRLECGAFTAAFWPQATSCRYKGRKDYSKIPARQAVM